MSCCDTTSPLFLSQIGERWDHEIHQGGMWGPFEAEMFNPDPPDGDGLQVDLTSCLIFGDIRKRPSDGISVAQISTSIYNQVTNKGRYKFWIPSEITRLIGAGPRITDIASRYYWDLWLRDSAGQQFRLYFGDWVVSRRIARTVP